MLKLRRSSLFAALICIPFVVFQTATIFAKQPANAYAHFIDVGQGDSILLEFPCGTVLIDAGGEETGPDKVTAYLNKYFARRPELNRTIDLMILTHGHGDHLRNADNVLSEFAVKTVLWDGTKRAWQRQLDKTFDTLGQTQIRQVLSEDIGPLGLTDSTIDPIACANVDPDIRVLWGGVEAGKSGLSNKEIRDLNNHSIAVRVQFGEAVMLFSGDMTRVVMKRLLKNIDHKLLDADLYQISHHGFNNGTYKPYVKVVSPRISVLSRSAGRPWKEKNMAFYSEVVEMRRSDPKPFDVWYLPPNTKNADYPRTGQDGTPQIWGIDRGLRRSRIMHKAVYWTGIDGDVVIQVGSDGSVSKVKLP